jgi:hypothetical protein
MSANTVKVHPAAHEYHDEQPFYQTALTGKIDEYRSACSAARDAPSDASGFGPNRARLAPAESSLLNGCPPRVGEPFYSLSTKLREESAQLHRQIEAGCAL